MCRRNSVGRRMKRLVEESVVLGVRDDIVDNDELGVWSVDM